MSKRTVSSDYPANNGVSPVFLAAIKAERKERKKDPHTAAQDAFEKALERFIEAIANTEKMKATDEAVERQHAATNRLYETVDRLVQLGPQ